MSDIADAVAEGTLPGRVWIYANYNCNLACTYCLTESSPRAPKRAMSAEEMIRVAREAAQLGFTDIGITGGEPFLLTHLPETLVEVARNLPTLVNTNGTVFTPARLARLEPLADLPFMVQISLDAADPVLNDDLRGEGNFETVLDTIPKVLDLGIRVRIATTGEADRLDDADMQRLRHLVTELGVPEEDHLIRTVIRRGRAQKEDLGVNLPHEQLPAELCITVDGAFWGPFGPTVRNDRTDTDLLISRATNPLSRPASLLLELLAGRPADTPLGIRCA